MWLARDVRGLTLFSDRPIKQKIVIENEGVKRSRVITVWMTPHNKPYTFINIRKEDDFYPWVRFENSPVEVKISPEGFIHD